MYSKQLMDLIWVYKYSVHFVNKQFLHATSTKTIYKKFQFEVISP